MEILIGVTNLLFREIFFVRLLGIVRAQTISRPKQTGIPEWQFAFNTLDWERQPVASRP